MAFFDTHAVDALEEIRKKSNGMEKKEQFKNGSRRGYRKLYWTQSRDTRQQSVRSVHMHTITEPRENADTARTELALQLDVYRIMRALGYATMQRRAAEREIETQRPARPGRFETYRPIIHP